MSYNSFSVGGGSGKKNSSKIVGIYSTSISASAPSESKKSGSEEKPDAYNFLKKGKKYVYNPIKNINDAFPVLPPKIYVPATGVNPLGERIYIFTELVTQDKLISFTNGTISEVIELSNKFFHKKTIQSYGDLGIIHKLGLIMYGPYGTGKSCTALLIMKKIIDEHNAIALDCTRMDIHEVILCISKLREIQNNPIVLFIDEVDSSFYRQEESFLSFLDGTGSVNNLLFIGCTNNIKEIPDRIKYRKSRIRHLVEIKSIPLEVYRDYVKSKIPNISSEDLAKFAFISEEERLTIDELKHAVIEFYVNGISIKRSIEVAKHKESLEE